VFPGEIGLRDPRSQKRDLGHPLVLPFDIAEGTSFVISLPTRAFVTEAVEEKLAASVKSEGKAWVYWT
jgi:hypothetical protein